MPPEEFTYPEESQKLDVITHLEELRKRIIYALAGLALCAIVAFLNGDSLMRLVRLPINSLVDRLIFIGPTEAFVAYVKVSLLAGFILCFPFILYQAWAFLSPALPKQNKKRVILWLLCALVLFFGGISFSYVVAIPTALNFLIGFGKEIASAQITLGKYISFFGALMLIGGVIFEIPIIIGLLTDVGIIDSAVLRKKRHYAALVILFLAAVITPTQDILNMLLFAVPMMILYEVGIIVARFLERKK